MLVVQPERHGLTNSHGREQKDARESAGMLAALDNQYRGLYAADRRLFDFRQDHAFCLVEESGRRLCRPSPLISESSHEADKSQVQSGMQSAGRMAFQCGCLMQEGKSRNSVQLGEVEVESRSDDLSGRQVASGSSGSVDAVE